VHVVDPDVARAGLDEQVTVDGVEGAVAGAAAQLDVAGL